MSYADNRYTATLSLTLFESAGDWQVRLADNGSLRTQRLDWFLDPKSEALLCPQVSIQGTSTGRQGEMCIRDSQGSKDYCADGAGH